MLQQILKGYSDNRVCVSSALMKLLSESSLRDVRVVQPRISAKVNGRLTVNSRFNLQDINDVLEIHDDYSNSLKPRDEETPAAVQRVTTDRSGVGFSFLREKRRIQ